MNDIAGGAVGVWRGETTTSDDGHNYPHGYGELIYTDEDYLNRNKYWGFMDNGRKEGHGTLWWKDGSYYSGMFKNDRKGFSTTEGAEGTLPGTLFYSNGDIYTGEWREDKKSGGGEYLYSTATGREEGNTIKMAYSSKSQEEVVTRGSFLAE